MKAHVLRGREAALEPHPQQHSEYLEHVKQPENDQYIDELLYVKGIGNTNPFQCVPLVGRIVLPLSYCTSATG